MWRVHKNRVDQGLGATYQGSGQHKGSKQGHNFNIPNVNVYGKGVFEGAAVTAKFDNPFVRWHKSLEDYNSHLTDIDDHPLTYTDEFERFKKYKPDESKTVGNSNIIPRQDNDEAFEFYDIQGESLYSNPPDQNLPTIDTGMDEEKIWAFNKTLYNQDKVKNTYTDQFNRAFKLSHAPFWGEKLTQPHFFKEEKLVKFYRQWGHRKGLEALKMKHAMMYGHNPTDSQKKAMQTEISNYIDACYQDEANSNLKDVYVTDHVAKEPLRLTNSEEEDQDFESYEQSVEAYNAESTSAATSGNTGKFARGSLLQRITDPFDGAPRNAEGTILYSVKDSELAGLGLDDEEYLRHLYNKRVADDEVWDVDEEDEEAFRLGLVEQLESNQTPFDVQRFHDQLNKELGVFGKGEKYSYVKDLKEAYQDSLRVPLEQRIFDTIPAHFFWDIKRPQFKAPIAR